MTLRPFAQAALLALLLPTGLAAQLITGRVVHEEHAGGLGDVQVVLLDAADARVGLALTDSLGRFALSVPEPGYYVLEATRIGLADVRAPVEIGEREVVELELNTSEEAIPLEPIEVVARRRIRRGTLDEFYDRMERNKLKGKGDFLTLAELERLERRSLPMALATLPGVLATPSSQSIRVIGARGPCTPDIYLDGMPLEGSGGQPDFDGLSPGASGFYPFGDGGSESFLRGFAGVPVLDLEGVEVYRGRFERAGGYVYSDCGTIFLWRKDDWGNPFGWTRLAIAGGFIGLVLFFL